MNELIQRQETKLISLSGLVSCGPEWSSQLLSDDWLSGGRYVVFKRSEVDVASFVRSRFYFFSSFLLKLFECFEISLELSIPFKGGYFAVSPTYAPIEDIITNVESGIRNLLEDVAEEIRTESARILLRAKH